MTKRQTICLLNLEQALLEAKRSGSLEAVFRELSKIDEAWWIVNRKGDTPNLDPDMSGIYIFTSKEKASFCLTQFEGKKEDLHGLKPSKRFSFPRSFLASINFKPPVVINRLSPEELTVSYEEVEKHSFK